MHRRFCMIIGMMALVLAGSTGCFTVAAAHTGGIFYTSVKGPGETADPTVKSTKVGRASAGGIFGFATGDASLRAAMEDGKIAKVHHVDYETTNVLGVYAKFTTVVYGE